MCKVFVNTSAKPQRKRSVAEKRETNTEANTLGRTVSIDITNPLL